MSSLRSPALGPIVGHTTDKSCRLWIQAQDPGDGDADLSEDRRTVGIISVYKKDGKLIPKSRRGTYYFRLHREYDRTGTFNLGADLNLDGNGNPFELEPDSTYCVRMGTLALDDSYPNDERVEDTHLLTKLPPAKIWEDDLLALPPEKSEAVFTTFPAKADNVSFMLGSCRYPGIFWKKKNADRIFGPLQMQAESDPNVRFVLMVGDQIYADMFNKAVPIGLADTHKEFQDRYHQAFGSKNMRRLLRTTPTYMILDDHEIEDNWTQDRIDDKKKRILFHVAIGAYLSYQWSHSPRTFGLRLFYHFKCGDYPFFVLDSRTQRYKNDPDDIEDNHLLGRPSLHTDEPSQLDILCDWLTKQQDAKGNIPKFIVSSTVFVPNTVDTIKDKNKNRSDSWPAFPTTRRFLLNHIVNNNIQNVVFLSGDIHCSNVAEITFSGSDQASALKAFSITSSAFYWPFPFADGDPSNFVHDSRNNATQDTFDLGGGIKMDYRAFNFTQEDNYCQVDIDRGIRSITVRAKDRDGETIRKSNGNPVESILQLAAW